MNKYEVTIKLELFENSDYTSEKKIEAMETCLANELNQLEGVDVISVIAKEVQA